MKFSNRCLPPNFSSYRNQRLVLNVNLVPYPVFSTRPPPMFIRKLLFFTSIVLTLSCDAIAGRPDFFARPVANYTWLPAASRHATYQIAGTGGASFATNQYEASGGGFGGGLSAGIIWGERNSFEFGIEGTITRFSGSYVLSQNSSRTSQHCTITVENILPSFRHFIGPRDAMFRPYWGVVLGRTSVDVSKPPSNGTATTNLSEPDGLAAGVTTGMAFRFGKHSQLELGYRLMGSWGISLYGSQGSFYRQSHTMSLAWRANF